MPTHTHTHLNSEPMEHSVCLVLRRRCRQEAAGLIGTLIFVPSPPQRAVPARDRLPDPERRPGAAGGESPCAAAAELQISSRKSLSRAAAARTLRSAVFTFTSHVPFGSFWLEPRLISVFLEASGGAKALCSGSTVTLSIPSAGCSFSV